MGKPVLTGGRRAYYPELGRLALLESVRLRIPSEAQRPRVTAIPSCCYPLLSMYAQSISRMTEMNSSAEQGSTIIWRKAAISDNGMGWMVPKPAGLEGERRSNRCSQKAQRSSISGGSTCLERLSAFAIVASLVSRPAVVRRYLSAAAAFFLGPQCLHDESWTGRWPD